MSWFAAAGEQVDRSRRVGTERLVGIPTPRCCAGPVLFLSLLKLDTLHPACLQAPGWVGPNLLSAVFDGLAPARLILGTALHKTKKWPSHPKEVSPPALGI